MSSHRTARQGLALVFAALSLTACGGSIDAQPEPRPAASAFAVEAPRRGDECGTAERPCILDEIRVSGRRLIPPAADEDGSPAPPRATRAPRPPGRGSGGDGGEQAVDGGQERRPAGRPGNASPPAAQDPACRPPGPPVLFRSRNQHSAVPARTAGAVGRSRRRTTTPMDPILPAPSARAAGASAAAALPAKGARRRGARHEGCRTSAAGPLGLTTCRWSWAAARRGRTNRELVERLAVATSPCDRTRSDARRS